MDWNESWVTVGTRLQTRMRTRCGEEKVGCGRWKKKSLQKVKSDQAEGCTIAGDEGVRLA